MKLRHFFSALLICLFLTACTSVSGNMTGSNAFVQAQKQSAIQLHKQGKLAQSLATWRTLLPLGSVDSETRNAIEELETKIDSGVSANLKKAKTSYSRGNTRQGNIAMLKVLALRPGQQDALQALGASYSAKAQAQQASKSQQETRVATERKSNSPDSIYQQMSRKYDKKDYQAVIALGSQAKAATEPKTVDLLRSAHTKLADKAEAGGKRDEALDHLRAAIAIGTQANDPLVARSHTLKKELGRYWYQQGTRLMKTDLPQAISALEKSLSYDEANTDAKRKLLQTQTLQRNLQKIEGKR
jgi:tetratricopeptide (TPR) repeat protein